MYKNNSVRTRIFITISDASMFLADEYIISIGHFKPAKKLL